MNIKSLFLLCSLLMGLGASAFADRRPSTFAAASILSIHKNHRVPAIGWVSDQGLATMIPREGDPQNLGELHERSAEAFTYAIGRSQELPSFNFTASNHVNANNGKTFPVQQAFAIPASLPITSGQATDALVRLLLDTQGGQDASCFYKANGASYVFDFCAPTSYEVFCRSSNGAYAVCKALANLGIESGHTVLAKAVSLQMNHCRGRCNDPTMQLKVTLKNFNDACGGLALSSVHLLNDVTCSGSGYVGLEMVGERNKFDGHGHAVVAPNSVIGLFVTGNNVSVRNVSVSEIRGGYGLMAYNTNGLILMNNRFRANLVGVNIYTDAADTSGLQIIRNDISANGFVGLFLNGDGKQTDNPIIIGNNLTNTGGYAISLNAKTAAFYGSQLNNFNGSRGVFYLVNGKFSVVDLDLSKSGATGPQIFVESAQSLTIKNVVLSYSAPAQLSQERTALHLYRVGSASIDQLIVNSSDVALKAATEQGTATNLTVTRSSITNSVTAGIMLQSYDSTAFGKVVIQGNTFTGNPVGYSVWGVGSTALGAGSVISGNTQ